MVSDSLSFEVKVGVHQGSILSPLLFAVVMDAVFREARAGLLFADDLVLMAHSRPELERKLQAWQRRLVAKGLKVNARKSNEMVSDGVSGETEETGA